ncbi:NAD(P)/FAD-dependent oxidoreductase [Streptomyces sp. SCSIO 30461]|uniref:flavin-containing monooxygenase n=1 Tax=Streptomyces sp. SCSIO 30461 TaxID=3118085 RepID=UPI0030CB356E
MNDAIRAAFARANDFTDDRPVYVIGAGPGGLAVAAALRERGVRAVVLEKSGAVGTSWRGHYDRLRLHTTRRLSSLPGLAMPRTFGRWVSRDDLVRYLEEYAEFHELELITGVEVTRVDPAGSDWVLHATGGRRLTGRAVVVATGFNHTPRLPDWPGREAYQGELLHASAYRAPGPYTGKDVLVVGAGNTGAEIAADLAVGDAARIRLSIRTTPHIVRRSVLGWPAQRAAILSRRLPVRLVDLAARALSRVAVPDLTARGLPRPDTGLGSRARLGAVPVLDVGLVDAVRKGRVEPVAAVESFDGDTVVLTDGSRITPDVVIAATGYRRGLEGLVGHLGVLDDRGRPVAGGRPKRGRAAHEVPGLYFTGFTNPISGMLRELGIDARKTAKRLGRLSAKEAARAATEASGVPEKAHGGRRSRN